MLFASATAMCVYETHLRKVARPLMISLVPFCFTWPVTSAYNTCTGCAHPMKFMKAYRACLLTTLSCYYYQVLTFQY